MPLRTAAPRAPATLRAFAGAARSDRSLRPFLADDSRSKVRDEPRERNSRGVSSRSTFFHQTPTAETPHVWPCVGGTPLARQLGAMSPRRRPPVPDFRYHPERNVTLDLDAHTRRCLRFHQTTCSGRGKGSCSWKIAMTSGRFSMITWFHALFR